ncbi:MAG TPA: hypothetical protein VNM16_00155 [Bacillota bacterium]|nr:hypothetical protein [Bacillota bacterium]
MLSVWAYPGDEVAGPISSFDAVSCAVVYHAAEMLLPNGHLRIMTPGARFQPDDGYRDLRPPCVAEDAEAAADRIHAAGRRFHAWTVLLHDDGAVKDAPRQQTCFGDPMPHSMCPSDERVRAYCVDLVSDLASRPWVDAIELESLYFGLWPHEWHHAKQAAPVDSAALSTCFCDACCRRAQAAGVDWRAAQRQVQERVLRGGPAVRTEYDSVRSHTITSLMATLPGRLIIGGSLLPNLWQVGIDAAAWRRRDLIVTLYGDAERKEAQAREQLGAFTRGVLAPGTGDEASVYHLAWLRPT